MSDSLISKQDQNSEGLGAAIRGAQAEPARPLATAPRLPAQYQIVAELEQYLGDPSDPATAFSFARSMALDEREQYPEEACRLLDQWGLPDYYVPVAAGGRLASFEQLLGLLRVVARRDFTVGFAYSILSLLGSTPVWAGGTAAQQDRLAALIKRGGQVALAYNEQAHGSDFMATEVAAHRTAEGFVLNGEKWLTGNVVRAAALTVIARTNETGGARGFSLFLVEKATLDATTYEHLPRLKTLGVRGAHVSGIRFKNCLLQADALIGTVGSGLEQTLKAFQLTRSLIPGLSLGAADTALRTTLDFALTRRLYGTSVFEIPQAQRQLVEAFVDVLACECLAVAVSRALQQTPEQLRLYSAAVKFFVQTTVEEMIQQNLSVILGARQYLREGHWSGIFQKLMRDSMVVRYHFNSALNLTTVAIHLRDLATYRARSGNDAQGLEARLAAIFDLRHIVKPFNPAKLQIYTRGRDDFMYGLDASLARLQSLEVGNDAGGDALRDITRLVSDLLVQVAAEDQRRQELEEMLGNDYATSPEVFEQSKRYCTLSAAAACVHMWVHNREHLGDFFGRGEWLTLCLHRLLNRLRPTTELWPRACSQAVAAELVRLYNEDKLFSILPVQLARTK